MVIKVIKCKINIYIKCSIVPRHINCNGYSCFPKFLNVLAREVKKPSFTINQSWPAPCTISNKGAKGIIKILSKSHWALTESLR